MATHAVTTLEDGLQRDLAILSTLAHLHCATVPQLHALCFPFHTLATARLTLHYLAEANFIVHSTWRLKQERDEGGQVWVLTAKGNDLLKRYVPHVPPLARIDLARPSTAIEHEEWRIRLEVRRLLIQLLLEARQMPLLRAVEVQLPWSVSWPTAWGQLHLPDPDACITITWLPPERKAADWLPWLEHTSDQILTIQYPIYLERTHAKTDLQEMLLAWLQRQPDTQLIPLLILRDEGRYRATVHLLRSLPEAPAVRLSSRSELHVGLTRVCWRDERGVASDLRPVDKLVVVS